MLLVLAVASLVIWLAIAGIGAWRVRESLDAIEAPAFSANDVTVLVPARNEADSIVACLEGLAQQGSGLHVVVIDDQSSDGTGDIASNAFQGNLQVISGTTLPPGWSGKLWALEQGRKKVTSLWTLLLDADIQLAPGTLAALLKKANEQELDFVSLMAHLRMTSFWERLLMPAFIYFFKLLYPFALSNNPRVKSIAAAAGGCILVKTVALENIGGFSAIREALIDDCTLAATIKQSGRKTWIGLTRSAVSTRAYNDLGSIWDMVARSAFTQLRYSVALLLLATLLMLIAFLAPVMMVIFTTGSASIIAIMALVLMMTSYAPVLKYYGRSFFWALSLPVIATLYLLMTWSSAVRYWKGQRSSWKGRQYSKSLDSKSC